MPFFRHYTINTTNLTLGSALSCAVVAGIIIVTLIPFVGLLSDRIGRSLCCALLNLVFAYPFFVLAIESGTFWGIAAGAHPPCSVSGVIDGGDRFDAGRDVSDARQIHGFICQLWLCSLLFGGSAALIATWLVSVTGNQLAPAFYVMTDAAISAVAVLSM